MDLAHKHPDKRPVGSSDVLALVGWFTLVFVAAWIGTIASVHAPEFYRELVRPRWAPPASVFGPVWSVLYALMALSAWLVWRERHERDVRPALVLFGVQLVANALWSWCFFAWHQGALAFADIVLLLALIAATGLAFRRIRPLAAALLVPYFAWVAFATALTWSVWQGNPGSL